MFRSRPPRLAVLSLALVLASCCAAGQEAGPAAPPAMPAPAAVVAAAGASPLVPAPQPAPAEPVELCAPGDTACVQRLATPGAVACWGSRHAWGPAPAEQPAAALAASTADDGYGGLAPAPSASYPEDDGSSDAATAAAVVANASVPTPLGSSLVFSTISAEDNYVCGLTSRGTIACFGSTTPMLPDDPNYLPPTELPFEGPFTKLATGATFACGLLANFSAACFGRMGDCQLWSGPGGSEARPTPLVVGGGLQFVELVAGSDHVCGVLFNGSAACWGSNSANQLGVDSADVATSLTPIAIADPSLAFVSLAAADTVSCGTLINASVACWGGYTDASQSELLPPQPRIVGADQIASLAARGSSMCGVTLQGQAGCAGVVGSYIDAQGYPETVFSEQPTPVPSPASFTTITVGGSGFYFHACGLTLEGAALCWGLNNEGQLGVPPYEVANSTAAVPVATDIRFSVLSAGGDYTCGVVA